MSVTQENFDQGRRALERFRKVIAVRYRPLLRAITEKPDLQVEPHASMAFTDGKTVYLPVPFALGEETLEHDKAYCGQRDPVTLKMLCPWCAMEDEVDGVVLHESAHLTEGSFNKVTWRRIQKWIQDDGVFGPTLKALDPERRKVISDRCSRATDAMEVAGILDRWLPFTTNVVEDIYVNRRLFKYREGAELPLRLFSKSIFEEGTKLADGSVSHWKEADVSAQAIISAYLIGQNLTECGSYLNPDADLTSEPGLVALVDSIPAKCDVDDRLEIALQMLLHLRDLGFVPAASDSVVTPPPPPSPVNKDSQPQPPSPGAEQQEPQPQEGGGGESDEEPQDGESQSEGGSDQPGDEEGEESETGDGQGESSGDEEGEGEQGSGKGDGDDTEAADDDEEASNGGGQGDESGEGEASDGSEGGDKTGEGEAGQESADTSKGDASNPGDDGGLQPLSDADIEEQASRAEELLTYIMGHDDSGPTGMQQDGQTKRVLDQVIKQEGFDHPSEIVSGLELRDRGHDTIKRVLPRAQRVEVPRSILSPSLSRLRVVFASNRKTGLERSLRSGSHLDSAHLARAGYEDEPRIFGRKSIPKNRDWFVLVGLDFSGSTNSNGADFATKMAGHAIGDLLHQLGIRFSMYAHTACSPSDPHAYGRALEIDVIKAPNENWKTKGVQETLFAQYGRSTNLDGHTLEQYRKMILQERATDKLLMYFTDGAMPNANFDEELALLKENIEILRRHRVNLLGIGYRTDSPKQHGLDTIRYNKPDDVKSIVAGLEDRLRR